MMKTRSEQITEGLRKSFQDTNCKMANRICYGYEIAKSGELIIKHAEAEVVRFIFTSYNKGDSLGKIAKQLEAKQILSPTGKAKWNREAISKLLSNEKYVGNVMLQKTHSFCGIQFANDGELAKVLMTNHHPAIISLDVFKKTQELKQQRAKAPKEEFTIASTF